MIGSVTAILGVWVVPRTGTLFSRTMIVAFGVLLLLDNTYGLAQIVNKTRKMATGRQRT